MERTIVWAEKKAVIRLRAALIRKRGTVRGITKEISDAITEKTVEILAGA